MTTTNNSLETMAAILRESAGQAREAELDAAAALDKATSAYTTAVRSWDSLRKCHELNDAVTQAYRTLNAATATRVYADDAARAAESALLAEISIPTHDRQGQPVTIEFGPVDCMGERSAYIGSDRIGYVNR